MKKWIALVAVLLVAAFAAILWLTGSDVPGEIANVPADVAREVVGGITGGEQQSSTEYVVGVSQWATQPEYVLNVGAFKKSLLAREFESGKNVRFVERNPEGNADHQRRIIQEFLDAKVHLIFVLTTIGTQIAREMVTEIPIVFSAVRHPVQAGLVASLDRSGNNLVGTRNFISPTLLQTRTKRLLPDLKTLGFVRLQQEDREGESSPTKVSEKKGSIKAVEEASIFAQYVDAFGEKGVNVVEIDGENFEELLIELEKLVGSVDAVYTECASKLTLEQEQSIIDLVLENGKAPLSCRRESVDGGALLAIEADAREIGEMAGKLAGQILSGTLPTDLATEHPLLGHVVINAATARRLGVVIPEDLREEAEMVE